MQTTNTLPVLTPRIDVGEYKKVPPISLLVDDLLASIFVLCAREAYENRPNTDWLHVLWVCRRWREVTTNCAGFWSYLDFSSTQLTTEMLLRSKEAPLYIRFHSWFYPAETGHRMQEAIQLALQRLYRVRELRLIVDSKSLAAFMPLLTAPAPLLEVVRVHTSGQSVECPDTLFSRSAPKLRHLSFDHCPPPLLPSLCQLRILCISSRSHRYQMSELVNALTEMQYLDYLLLDGCLPITGEEGLEIIPEPVNLPRMKTFTICDKLKPCHNVFNRLLLPAQSTLNIRCRCDSGTSRGDGAAIVRSVNRHLDRHGLELKTLQLCQTDYAFFNLSGDVNVDKSPVPKYSFDVNVVFVDFEGGVFDADALIGHCHALRLGNVQTLVTYMCSRYDEDMWSNCLKDLKRLRKVVTGTLDGGFAHLRALLGYTRNSAEAGTSFVAIAPDVECVAFRALDFDASSGNENVALPDHSLTQDEEHDDGGNENGEGDLGGEDERQDGSTQESSNGAKAECRKVIKAALADRQKHGLSLPSVILEDDLGDSLGPFSL